MLASMLLARTLVMTTLAYPPELEIGVHVNILDFAQFGVAPTFELGGEHWSVYTRVRFLNTGPESYYLIGDPSEFDQFIFGMGGGLGLRGYFAGDELMSGFYVGAGMEYIYTRVDDDYDDLASWRTHSIAPVGEFGYRWSFWPFFLGLGLAGGAAFPVASGDKPIGFGGCYYTDSCTGERDVFPVILVNLELGFMFAGT